MNNIQGVLKNIAEDNEIDITREYSNWFSVEHEGWCLPGTKEPRFDCGQFVRYGCLNVHKHPEGKAFVRTHQITCFKSSCKICWKKWISREAFRGTQKIEKYGKLVHKPAKHIVLSIPTKDWYLDFKKLKDKARWMLKKNKIHAGCLIFHPFRDSNLGDYIDWRYAPHFHVIGFGWIESDIVKDTYDTTEYIVANLGVRQSVHKTLRYQLSHCGIHEGFHSITWFGDLSYSKLPLSCHPDIDDEYRKCPHCQAELKPILIETTLDRPPPDWCDGMFEGLVSPEGIRESKWFDRETITYAH